MSFFENEDGAVTVDWVVLTAALVGLGLAVGTVVSSGVEDLSTDIDQELSSQIIRTNFNSNHSVDLASCSDSYAGLYDLIEPIRALEFDTALDDYQNGVDEIDQALGWDETYAKQRLADFYSAVPPEHYDTPGFSLHQDDTGLGSDEMIQHTALHCRAIREGWSL